MNITAVKDALGRKITGASLDSVQGISDYSLFKEAAVNVLNEIDPAETVRHSTLNIFDGIYDYDPNDDVKELLDIRPQTYSRDRDDRSRRRGSEDFDWRKSYEQKDFSIEFVDGTKVLRYAKDIGGSVTVTETTDDNWTAGTGVSNIAEDNDIFSEDSLSLRFDVASGTSYLEWNGDTAIDLDDHELRSSLFMWVYYPDSSIISSLAIRIGSSSSAYYTITGSIHFGSIRTGWNLYRFDWNGATETGSVTETAIDYARVTLVTTSADTDIRIGKLTSKLPEPRECVYYSNYLFRSTAGTFKEVPTTDTDIVNLDTDGENIFLTECARIAARELRNSELRQQYTTELFGDAQTDGLYARYKGRHPSEGKPMINNYWSTRRFGRARTRR